MTTAVDFSFFKNLFTGMTLFNESWIIGVILCFLIVLIISRDPNKWGSLFLPIFLTLNILGIQFGTAGFYIILMCAIVVFAVSGMGVENIAMGIQAVSSKFSITSGIKKAAGALGSGVKYMASPEYRTDIRLDKESKKAEKFKERKEKLMKIQDYSSDIDTLQSDLVQRKIRKQVDISEQKTNLMKKAERLSIYKMFINQGLSPIEAEQETKSFLRKKRIKSRIEDKSNGN